MTTASRMFAVAVLSLAAPPVGAVSDPLAAGHHSLSDLGSASVGTTDRWTIDASSGDAPPDHTPFDVGVDPSVASFGSVQARGWVGPSAEERADVEPVEAPGPPASTFIDAPTGTPLDTLPDPICIDAIDVDGLTEVFGRGGALLGADYQRAFPLDGGRVLWLLQDAFLETAHGPELVHNVGLLQSGHCFQLVRNGSEAAPAPFLFSELTDRFDRWFWPLGGDIGDDGSLHVFVAEMRERGADYLEHTEPIATWLVTIDPVDLSILDQRLAPNSSADLYGWSVVSHGDYSYLYAHCYRQFGWDPFPFTDGSSRTHDWGCGPNVSVGRVPLGRFDVTPEYWDGLGWVTDPGEAVAVFPTDDRSVNPVQVAVLDGRFIAATKVGDWWGQTVHLDVAHAPEGPWRTYATVDISPRCEECNTYFASIVPFGRDNTSFLIALSNNTWGGHDLENYVPSFHRVDAPTTHPSPHAEAATTPPRSRRGGTVEGVDSGMAI